MGMLGLPGCQGEIFTVDRQRAFKAIAFRQWHPDQGPGRQAAWELIRLTPSV